VVTKKGLKGFASSKYLAQGDGDLAKLRLDMANLGPRPKNGHIFIKKGSGDHKLMIDNGRYDDAIVKLKDLSGRTILSFYVRVQQKVQIKSIPEGNYKIRFACGKSYSNKRGYFLEGMTAMSFPDINPFITKIKDGYIYTSVVEYTLHEVLHGNVHANRISLEDFIND